MISEEKKKLLSYDDDNNDNDNGNDNENDKENDKTHHSISMNNITNITLINHSGSSLSSSTSLSLSSSSSSSPSLSCSYCFDLDRLLLTLFHLFSSYTNQYCSCILSRRYLF